MAENEGLTPPSAGADKPPRTRPTQGRGAGRPAKGDIAAKIIDGWTGLYALAGAGVLVFNQYDGSVIVHKSHDMAVALEQVARRNKDVYRWLARFAEANDFTAIFKSYGAVGAAIGANHGLLPVRVVDAFELPRPPEREEAASPYPAPERYSEGVVDNGSGQYVPMQEFYPPAEQAVPMAPNGEVPTGLHVSEDIVAKLRAEALRHAMEEAGIAAQRGEEGQPDPRTNPRGAMNG